MTFIRPLSRLATNSLPIKNRSSLCYASCLIPGPSNGCLQLIRSYTNDCQEGTTIFSRKSIQETTSESIEEVFINYCDYYVNDEFIESAPNY